MVITLSSSLPLPPLLRPALIIATPLLLAHIAFAPHRPLILPSDNNDTRHHSCHVVVQRDRFAALHPHCCA